MLLKLIHFDAYVISKILLFIHNTFNVPAIVSEALGAELVFMEGIEKEYHTTL